MNCNNDIHNELKETEVVCPFCDQNWKILMKNRNMMNAVIISILLMTMGC